MIDLTVADLAMFACAGRDDWDRDDMTGAVTAARSSGWTWERLTLETARLMADPEGAPRDLREACRDPLERSGPAVPGAYERGAAAAKAELAGVLIAKDQAAAEAAQAARAERDRILRGDAA